MKRVFSFVLALFLVVTAAGCSNAPKNQVHGVADLPGKTVGVLAGSQAAAMQASLVQAGAQVVEFADADAMMQSLLNGAGGVYVDCVVTDSDRADALRKQYRKTKILSEEAVDVQFSAVVAKENVDLTANLNAAIAALMEDGTIGQIVQAWVLGQEYESAQLSGETGITLAVASCPPYASQGTDGTVTGLDVDIARAICAYLGINLEVVVFNQEELVDKIQTGRADFAMGRLTHSEEDAQLVDFTDPYMTCHQAILVRKK